MTLQPTSSPVERAQRFRFLVDQQRWEEARVMLTADPRRWFEAREGEGDAWKVGPRSRPWAGWDAEFRSHGEVLEWRQGEGTATARVRETNDYFRLLERGSVTNELTYFFDDADRIEGLLIRGAGERPPGRTEEFVAWARAHAPDELAELMPDGEIDPSGDHPARFRRLLVRWREAADLAPLDPAGAPPSG